MENILNSKHKLDFDDILIKSNTVTTIKSRSEIDITKGDGMLPLFTAPMDTVVNENNEKLFKASNVNICLPRNEKTNFNSFTSYSLSSFIDDFLKPNPKAVTDKIDGVKKVLIDTANGHIDDMVSATRDAKLIHGDSLLLMVGNVSNPETYRLLSNAGADLIRIGVGNGSACLTTYQTGIGYPMASLIAEVYSVSSELDNPAKIVADGGMKKYSDIIKALALGADYVMLGGILNKTIESCGDNYLFNFIKVNNSLAEFLFDNGFKIKKKFRGMSTKEVQKKWGSKILKTSEGVVRKKDVEYKLSGWCENFDSYLRSAMSYCDARTLKEFREKAKFSIITDNGLKRFDK